jgi:hypothetical protein
LLWGLFGELFTLKQGRFDLKPKFHFFQEIKKMNKNDKIFLYYIGKKLTNKSKYYDLSP